MSEEGNICAITWIWIWKKLFECLWEVNISVNIREFPFTEHYRTYFSFLLFFCTVSYYYYIYIFFTFFYVLLMRLIWSCGLCWGLLWLTSFIHTYTYGWILVAIILLFVSCFAERHPWHSGYDCTCLTMWVKVCCWLFILFFCELLGFEYDYYDKILFSVFFIFALIHFCPLSKKVPVFFPLKVQQF